MREGHCNRVSVGKPGFNSLIGYHALGNPQAMSKPTLGQQAGYKIQLQEFKSNKKDRVGGPHGSRGYSTSSRNASDIAATARRALKSSSENAVTKYKKGMARALAAPTNNDGGTLESIYVGKNSSFKIYKPQVQGTSLCTWGVVRRELCSKYWN